MTRMQVITIALTISGCEHGQTPPPGCGNGRIDFGEPCDDGNDIADDGCDQCVSTTCGNGRFDDFEQCDDGNTMSGDGCSADCLFEETFGGLLTSFWSFGDLDGTITGCPAGFPRIDIEAFSPLNGQFLQSFDCSAGASSMQLPRDLFKVTAQSVSMDASQLFATSVSAQVDLRFGDGSFQTTFFNDAGFFKLGWVLKGAVTNNVLNCGQAGVVVIESDVTPNGAQEVFDCNAGEAFTVPLAAGDYSITLTAKNQNAVVVGTGPVTAGTITVPNGITQAGMITIPIPGM